MSSYPKDLKLIDLKTSLSDHILTITLNNEGQSNAFTTDMIKSFCDVLRVANYDKNIRVVVLTGAGKNFCAGGDIKAMNEKTGMFAGESIELRERYSAGIQQIPLSIESFKKPIIAMINGAAIGAGCDLAAMCDLRICSSSAKFGETFTKLALVPGDGGPYFLARVIGYAKAMQMYLTANIYDSSWALEHGLVSSISSDEKLLDDTMKLARQIANNSPVAVEYTKMAMKRALKDDLAAHLNFVSLAQGITQRSHDHENAVYALINKGDVNFEGH